MMRIDVRPIVIDKHGNMVDDRSEEDKEFHRGWQPVSSAVGKDMVESVRVGRVIHAAVKQCWFNARKAIQMLDEYANASYVEGWACLPFPIEHGWIVRNGKIIDPTLPDNPGVYFAGLEFRGRTGIDQFLATPQGRRHKTEPFFYAFGWGGMESPSFRKCCDDAMAYLKEHFGPSSVNEQPGGQDDGTGCPTGRTPTSSQPSA